MIPTPDHPWQEHINQSSIALHILLACEEHLLPDNGIFHGIVFLRVARRVVFIYEAGGALFDVLAFGVLAVYEELHREVFYVFDLFCEVFLVKTVKFYLNNNRWIALKFLHK